MTDLIVDDLNAYSSMSDLLDALALYHINRGPTLASARLVLERVADEMATGTGAAQSIVLTSADRTFSVAEIFTSMDRPQAGRFLDELFNDILPHIASQKSFLEDLSKGQTPSGMIVRQPLLQRVVGLLSGQSEERRAVAAAQVQIRALTWVDDQKREIRPEGEIELVVDDGTGTPKRRGGFSF